MDALGAKAVPLPSGLVFQPRKLYPVRLNHAVSSGPVLSQTAAVAFFLYAKPLSLG